MGEREAREAREREAEREKKEREKAAKEKAAKEKAAKEKATEVPLKQKGTHKSVTEKKHKMKEQQVVSGRSHHHHHHHIRPVKVTGAALFSRLKTPTFNLLHVRTDVEDFLGSKEAEMKRKQNIL